MKLKTKPTIPKEAVNAIEDLRYFVLNTLSTMFAEAQKNVPTIARSTHDIQSILYKLVKKIPEVEKLDSVIRITYMKEFVLMFDIPREDQAN